MHTFPTARLHRRIALLLSTATCVAITTASLSCRSLPASTPGPEAEALADRMLAAINHEAWLKNTAAVSWTFRDKRRLLWDKRRNFVQVQWKGNDVRFNKVTMHAVVKREGVLVTDPQEARTLLGTANASFVNDAFWLNPLFHIRAPGSRLSLVAPGILKVHYPSGGVTPGDSYVFYTDGQALVTQMRLWVSSVPLKGTGATFLNYATGETGVKSARTYDFLVTIEIGDVKMYGEYPSKDGADVFADLVAE